MPRIRGGRVGIHVSNDGHRYRCKSKSATRRFFVCCGSRDQPCPARGYIVNGSDQIILTKSHNHTSVFEKIACEAFKDALWTEMVSTEEDPRIIYDRLAVDHPMAASIVTFATIEASMGRWRRENHPPLPRTLLEFDNLINIQQWRRYREYSQGSLSVHTIHVNANTSVTIFGDPAFLASQRHIEELHIDATFDVCPKQCEIYQLLTIMGRIDESTVPLAWALMSNKTEPAYRAVFDYFKNNLAPNIQPRKVYQDFERALRNAIVHTYPNITVIHCYFHYAKALLRRVKVKGRPKALEILSRWELGKICFRKMVALALLPAAEIAPAFRWLIRNTPPNIRYFFADLIAYYERWWLRSITPEVFSVYLSTDRTNNRIESYHRILSRRFGNHPRIWQFTAKLRDLQAITRIEVDSLDRGIPIRRNVSRQNQNREHIFNRIWELHQNGSWDYARFFACANHVSEAFNNPFVITTADEVDLFLTTEAHDVGAPPPENALGDVNWENFNARQRIPIQHITAAERNVQILVIEDLNRSLCPACRRSILDVVSFPCKHWFVCQDCTTSLTLQAFMRQAALICGICGSQCLAFKTLRII